jgi:hypothetical protein
VGNPFAGAVVQVVPHAPQLVSVFTSVSHPLVSGAVLSQSP